MLTFASVIAITSASAPPQPVVDIAKIAGDIVGGAFGTLLLLLPGWVLVTVYDRGTPGPPASDRTFASGTAFGGVLVHLLAAWWTVPLLLAVLQDGPVRHAYEIVDWAAVVLLIAPALLGAFLSWISDEADRVPWAWLRGLSYRLGFSTTVRTPDAWPIAFRDQRGQGRFVIVTLRDTAGSRVLGKYGMHSAASSDSSRHDLYLQQVWVADADGWFDKPSEASKGIWIAGDEIRSVEFYIGSDE